MTTTDQLDLLKRIIDAFDYLQGAQLDLKPEEHERFWAALAGCIREADAVTGRRKERGPVPCMRPVPPGGGFFFRERRGPRSEAAASPSAPGIVIAVRIFELRYPGTWIEGLQSEKVAFQASNLLSALETDLADAAVALELFEQAQATFRQYMERGADSGGVPVQYRRRLPFLYAHALLFALDGIAKVLEKLKSIPGLPTPVARACDAFRTKLPGVVPVRDSAHHREDRIRGRGRREQPLALKPISTGGISAPGGVIVLSNLNGNRLGYTTGDGHLTEVEISAATVEVARGIIQAVLDGLTWSGPPRVSP